MTKQELNQLYYLNESIKRRKKRIQEVEAKAEYKGISLTGMPTSGKVSDNMADCAADAADLKALLELDLKKVQILRKRIMRYINTLEDARLREIMTCKHVYGMPWDGMEEAIGLSDRQIRRIYYGHFKKNNKTCP